MLSAIDIKLNDRDYGTRGKGLLIRPLLNTVETFMFVPLCSRYKHMSVVPW